jgi:hypothetical protein
MALNRQTLSAVGCPLLDKSGQRTALGLNGSAANDRRILQQSVAGVIFE